MAASGFQTIQLYNSTTSGTAPVATNLVSGELAINITDGKLYYKDNGGTVKTLASNGTSAIGGSNTQVQYNNSGVLAGSSNLTFNGTTLTANTLNLTNALGTGYGGTGLTSFTANGVLYASGTGTLATGSALTFDGTKFGVSLAQAKLQLTSTTGTNSAYQAFTNTGGNFYVGIDNSTGTDFGAAYSGVMWNGGAYPLLFGVGNAEQMRLTSTGLGIGTSSPSYKLDVNGVIAVNGTQAVQRKDYGYSASYKAIQVGLPASTYGSVALAVDISGVAGGSFNGQNQVILPNNGALFVNAAGTNFIGAIARDSSNRILLGPSTNAGVTSGDVVIDTSGNLGIGTSSPAYKLDVSGVIRGTSDALISGLTVGKGAGAGVTSTVVGYAALASTSSDTSATALGFYALNANTTGGQNTAVGRNTLIANTTGSYNTAVGMQSLNSNTTASNNTAVGYQAFYNLTSPSNQIAIGYQAGYSLTTGGVNTFIGYQAGYNISTTSYNIAIGSGALIGGAGTTSAENLAIGWHAGIGVTSGGFNVLIGNETGKSLTTGTTNVAIGQYAFGSNTTGNNNTVVGQGALRDNANSPNNTAIGYQAALTSGGQGVVALGAASATTLASGNYGTYIGYQSTASGAGVTAELVVCSGGSTTGKGANTGFISPNNGAVYQGNNSASWSTTSDQRLKKNIVDNNDGLDKINAIRVRNFEYRLPEEVDAELKPTDAINKTGVQLGVIAQELQQVLPECVKQESTGVLSVDPDSLTWYLVNAVKQLSAEVKSLKSQLKGN